MVGFVSSRRARDIFKLLIDSWGRRRITAVRQIAPYLKRPVSLKRSAGHVGASLASMKMRSGVDLSVAASTETLVIIPGSIAQAVKSIGTVHTSQLAVCNTVQTCNLHGIIIVKGSCSNSCLPSFAEGSLGTWDVVRDQETSVMR